MKEQQLIIREIFQTIYSADHIDNISNEQLKDELRVMPGSLLKKIFDAWQAQESIPNDHRRSIRYLRKLLGDQDISSIYDKMRGYTGIQENDTKSLLICVLNNWEWDHDNQCNVPIVNIESIDTLVKKLLKALYSHHKKLLMIRFEGQDIFRFFRKSPENYGITFVSSAHKSLLYSAQSKGILSNFERAVTPYIDNDERNEKNVVAWVLDIGNTNVADKDSYRRYQNLWNVAGALRSLQLFNQAEAQQREGLFLSTSSDDVHRQRSRLVQYAMEQRMIVIIRGLPSYMKTHVISAYSDIDGSSEPSNKSYERLVSDTSDLTSDHFVLPSPLTLWPHDQSLKMFIPLDYDGDDLLERLDLTTSISVEPAANTELPELKAEYWCLGNPVSRGERGRPSAFEADNDSFMAVRMNTPSTRHDKAFQLLYFATAHRLQRKIFKPGDSRASLPLITGSNVIWALRKQGLEVMSARMFLKTIMLEDQEI